MTSVCVSDIARDFSIVVLNVEPLFDAVTLIGPTGALNA